jgi:hypothetical protein
MSPRAVVNVGNMVAASRECCIIDGTFPDWRRVVPADVDGEAAPGWFNVGYLADFAKAAKILGDYFGKSQSMMSVHGADAGAPALVRFASDRVFAVLMPMRGNDTTGQRPAYYDARPYPVAEVEISRLDSDTRYPYTADDKAWHFTVSTSLSPITAKESRRFTFPTKAKAARAYNRILAGLQARGMMGGVEPIYPHYDLKPEALKALEDRAERIKEAREAFEAAEPIDLDQPWKRDAVKPEYPSLARHAFMNLPSISEGRAMQSFYKAAA